MVLVFILELAGGISGYVLRNDAQAVIEQKMYDSMPKYKEGSEIYDMWDQLQRDVIIIYILATMDHSL